MAFLNPRRLHWVTAFLALTLGLLSAMALAACGSADPGNPGASTPTPSATPDLMMRAANATSMSSGAQTAAVDAQNAAQSAYDQMTDTAKAPTVSFRATQAALQVKITEASLKITDAAMTADAVTGTAVAAEDTATATAVKAESDREDVRQNLLLQGDIATHTVATWTPWIVMGIVIALALFASGVFFWIVISGYKELLPRAASFINALEQRARTFIMPDGPVYIPAPGDNARVVNASRMLQPVLHVGEHQAVGSGGAKDETIQARMAARAQVAVVAAAWPRPQTASALQETIGGMVAEEEGAGETAVYEIPPDAITILPPDHPAVRPVVTDVSRMLLASGHVIGGGAHNTDEEWEKSSEAVDQEVA